MARLGVRQMSGEAPVCAILPTQLRRREILEALEKIHACDPAPAEVRVHVNGCDGAPVVTEKELLSRFPNLAISRSAENLGPGGARNRLIEASGCEYIAGFDDDSWPIDGDYFARVTALFDAYPEASVLSSAIFHRGEPARPDARQAWWVWDYIGCGCAYRKSKFVALGGHVVRPVPYTIEEPDLCMRLMASGEKVLHAEWLRVRHDTTLGHHADPQINAGALANVALAGWVRYPASLMWRIPFQVANRLVFCIRDGRWSGLFAGLCSIPGLLWYHRRDRRPVGAENARRFLLERASRHRFEWRVRSHVEGGHCDHHP